MIYDRLIDFDYLIYLLQKQEEKGMKKFTITTIDVLNEKTNKITKYWVLETE